MTKTYERQIDNEVTALVAAVRRENHRYLEGADVAVDVLMVSDIDDESGEVLAALKLHGYPAQATIKIVGPAQRALGQGDALMTLDFVSWRELPPAARRALIDHELTHLEVVCGKKGEIKRDDSGRPKLKMRLHDYEIGGFREVIERHGKTAPEVITAKACAENGQYFWDFDAPRLRAVG